MLHLSFNVPFLCSADQEQEQRHLYLCLKTTASHWTMTVKLIARFSGGEIEVSARMARAAMHGIIGRSEAFITFALLSGSADASSPILWKEWLALAKDNSEIDCKTPARIKIISSELERSRSNGSGGTLRIGRGSVGPDKQLRRTGGYIQEQHQRGISRNESRLMEMLEGWHEHTTP